MVRERVPARQLGVCTAGGKDLYTSAHQSELFSILYPLSFIER